jgi:methionine-rich copper-binding protein CopC
LEPDRLSNSPMEIAMRIPAALFGLAALFAAGPAFAHAHLKASTPAADTTVAASPETLSCSFTEALEGRLSSLLVRDAGGKQVADGASLAPSDTRQLVLKLPHLAPGIYRVEWVAVSVDTHRTEGSFRFTVAP